MGLLEIFFTALILVFPIAEIGRIQLSGFAISVNDIFLLLVLGTWILKKIKSKENMVKRSLFKPIALFFAVGAISLILNSSSLNPSSFLVSLLYLLRWLFYALIYFVVLDFTPSFRKKIPYLLLFSSSVILFTGYFQFVFYQNLRNLYYLGWDEHLYRMFSSFLDPNFAGAFFVLSLIFYIGMLKVAFEKKHKLFVIILSLLSVLNLIAINLTYSRSALILLVVALFTFLILLNKRKLIILVSLILIVFVFLSPKSFQTEGTNIFRIASSEARLESAGNALSIIKDNITLGVGFNSYRYAQLRYGFVKGSASQTTHSGAGTDNSFLFILATTGVIGFVSYLYLLYKMFLLGFSNRKKNIYSVILISSLAGILIDSLFINSLFYVFIMQWIWTLAGLTESS